VTPFEHAKLRMLNGTHSGLAYLGYLAGHETIADTIADPPFAAFVWRLWNEEIIPSLKPPPGTDLGVYAGQLFERYRNPAIRHRTWQIAMDGSQKLPQRLLGTLRDQLRDGRPVRLLSHAIAGWMHYVEGTDEYGQAIDVRDPLRDVLQARLRTAGSEARARVASLLAIETVFGGDLALHAGFVDDLAAAYDSLRRLGVRQTLINLTEP
jgi:fructuronate reductase